MGKKSGTISLVSLLSVIIFVVSIVLSGGVYFYQNLLAKQIVASQVSLEKAKGAFDPATITDLVRLDSRIEGAKELLAKHVAISPLFSVLEGVILKSVRFENLNLVTSDGGRATLRIKGQALNYSSVAFQSDEMAKIRFFKDQIFSDLNLDQGGNVSFNFSTSVDPNLISFENLTLENKTQ